MAKLSDIKGGLNDTVTLHYTEEIAVTMRPLPNPEFDAHVAGLKRGSGLRHFQKGGKRDEDEEHAEIVKEAIAHTVVTNISGIEEMPTYDPALALTWFRDRELYDFYAWIRMSAADIGNFVKERDEAAAKN